MKRSNLPIYLLMSIIFLCLSGTANSQNRSGITAEQQTNNIAKDLGIDKTLAQQVHSVLQRYRAERSKLLQNKDIAPEARYEGMKALAGAEEAELGKILTATQLGQLKSRVSENTKIKRENDRKRNEERNKQMRLRGTQP